MEKERSHGNNFRNGLFKWQFLRSLHFPKNSSTLLPSANKSKITYIYTLTLLWQEDTATSGELLLQSIIVTAAAEQKFFFLKKKSISSQHQKYLLL